MFHIDFDVALGIFIGTILGNLVTPAVKKFLGKVVDTVKSYSV
jgi:hypothetical protein